MGLIKWYKRDPDAALSGMMGLTLEERGAFNTVLDLIYTRANNLPDDDRFIAGWLGSDLRVWRRIKSRLIALEKIVIKDGRITNLRATSEVLEALSRVGSAREAGLTSARIKAAKSQDKSNENNGKPSTNVPTEIQRTLQLTTPTPTTTKDLYPKGYCPSGDKPVTIEELVSDWNEFAEKHGLSKVTSITTSRRAQFNARVKDFPGPEPWRAAFRTIRKSPFLRGDNPRGWKADFDFMLQAKSFTKLVEGSYGTT